MPSLALANSNRFNLLVIIEMERIKKEKAAKKKLFKKK